MNEDAKPRLCPQCGSPIPEDAPGGLCPKCVLGGAATATEAGQPPEKPVPPTIEQVRAAFPNLEILELIGQGGMGFVYKARQPKLDRLVAVKLLWPRLAAQPAFAERFNREARVLARLNHPNIVAVYDFGQAGDFFYLLMEFVDGVNMRQAMRSGRFSPAEAFALVPRICDALQYAHEEGILHRDIKPENILLDSKGRLKIADFGIAKLLGERTGDIALTETGVAVGTPHYMAPEQLEHPQDVDQRADIYSLGVVFYEMLTGELPVGRFAPPSEKSTADPRVDEVVLRTLEKQREKRYSNAGEVRTRVEDIRSSPPPAGSSGQAGGSTTGPHGTMPLGASPRVDQPATTTPRPALPPAQTWSKKAIAAALCDAVALVPAALAILIIPFTHAGMLSGPPAWVILLKGLLLFGFFFGLPALAGTVLGFIALGDVRRSAGHLRGGLLALAAALFWPLLIGNLLLLRLVTVLVFRNINGAFSFALPAPLLVLAIVDFLIFAALWRWSMRGGKTGSRLSLAAVVCVLGLLALPVLVLALAVWLPAAARMRVEPPPPATVAIGTPNTGVDAQFTLPAGQVAIFEILSRKDGAIELLDGLSGYAIAAPDEEASGTFKCGPARQFPFSDNTPQPWSVDIAFGGNKSAVSGLTVPGPVTMFGGSISTRQTLQPDSESMDWAGEGGEGRPVIGLRIRTFRAQPQLASHNSTSGIGTNWLKAVSAEADAR